MGGVVVGHQLDVPKRFFCRFGSPYWSLTPPSETGWGGLGTSETGGGGGGGGFVKRTMLDRWAEWCPKKFVFARTSFMNDP